MKITTRKQYHEACMDLIRLFKQGYSLADDVVKELNKACLGFERYAEREGMKL